MSGDLPSGGGPQRLASDPGGEVTIFGVRYQHARFSDGGDLYLTEHGMEVGRDLGPEIFDVNGAWFLANSRRLPGTSTLYRVRTRKTDHEPAEVVLKWNRMGQDVPFSGDSGDLLSAEFNSPFEEFALVAELREAALAGQRRFEIQVPLAIYVSAERVELDRTGRRKDRVHAKIALHKDVHLDMLRPYAVVYRWMPGIDAAQAWKDGRLDTRGVEDLTLRTRDELRSLGFVVRDSKPHHVIVQPEGTRSVARTPEGNIMFGLVDFELLERTEEREAGLRRSRRLSYLERQRDRFVRRDGVIFPRNLTLTSVLGVDYVFGRAESTGGCLWVVGRDPYLFDYFLPERWEKMQRTRLSAVNAVYHTVTKDSINLVWAVSRVGLGPDLDPSKDDEKEILDYGYNSPFEEIELALFLRSKGVATTYPRAVYAVETRSKMSGFLVDSSRYRSHAGICSPDGLPVLDESHDYVTIWGFWNGPDEKLAECDANYYEAVDALRAYREGLLTRDEYLALVSEVRRRMAIAEVEDLNLRGNHLMLSLDATGTLLRDAQGLPEVRICNFELLRRRGGTSGASAGGSASGSPCSSSGS